MRIDLDGALVLACLAVLLALGAGSDRPFFESVAASRLTYFSLLGLPLFVLLGLLRSRWERMAAMARDWWQVLGVLLVYENLKHQHANRITEWLGIPPRDPVMLRADELLFGKCLALWFDTPFFAGELSHVLWFFYVWVYYLGPLVLLGWAYFVLEDDALFRLLRRSLVFGLLGGYVFYLLVPVAGPLFTIGDRFTIPILTQPTLQKLAFSTLRYNWDCFPSLHTAIPWLLTFTAWARLPRRGRALAVVAASGVTLSTVALRFHYGIDVVAGVAWAAIVFLALRRLAWLRELGFALPLPSVAGRREPGRGPAIAGSVVAVATGFVLVPAAQAAAQLLASLLGSGGARAAEALPVALAGLAVGAVAGAPRLRARGGGPLWPLAAAAGGIAFASFLLFVGYERVLPAWQTVAPALAGPAFLWRVSRLLVAAVVVGPFALFAGIAFPAAMEVAEGVASGDPRRTRAGAWTSGVLGACAGAVFGPWFAFPRWGVEGTLLFAYAAGGIVALVALRLALASEVRTPTSTGAVPASPGLESVGFAVGFLLLSLLAVTRHLTPSVLGVSVYAAATPDALLLVGLVLGSMVADRLGAASETALQRLTGGLVLAGALLLAWQQRQWPVAPARLADGGAGVASFRTLELERWAAASPLVVPGALFLGAALAVLIHRATLSAPARPAAAGRMLAATAAGGLAGAILAGRLLVPRLGSEATLLALSLAGVVLAPVCAWRGLGRPGRAAFSVVALAAVVAVSSLPSWDTLALVSGEGSPAHAASSGSPPEVRFLREDARGGVTAVVRDVGDAGGRPRLILLSDGIARGSVPPGGAASTAVPLTAVLHLPRRGAALVLGFGAGWTAVVADLCGFTRLDVVEPSSGVVAAARAQLGGFASGVLESRGVEVGEARAFLLGRERAYDWIFVEGPDPVAAGSGGLLSREFFQLAKSRLSADGLLQLRLPLDRLGPAELGATIATLRSAIPHVSVWCVGGEGFALASRNPQRLRGEALPQARAVAARLGVPPAGVDGFLRAILLSRVLSPEDTLALARALPFPPVTDGNRLVEYAAPRAGPARGELYARNLGFLVSNGTFAPFDVAGFARGAAPGWIRDTGRDASFALLGIAPAAPRRPPREEAAGVATGG